MMQSSRALYLPIAGLAVLLVIIQIADGQVLLNSTADEGCPEAKMDVVFLVDRSGSIANNRPVHQQGTNWEDVINFMTGLVQELIIGPDNVQVAMVTFGDEAILHFNFTAYPTSGALLANLEGIEYVDEGNTNTTAGILTVMETFDGDHGHRPDANKVCIILIDGNSTHDTETAIPNAEQAHYSGIRMLAIGVGDQINREELRGISSLPHELNETYWLSPTFSSLTQLSETVLSEICKASTLPECDIVDVVILMDASGSIHGNWHEMQDFVIDLISSFPVGEDKTRISLVRFSNNATVDFHLNEIYSRSEMVSLVRYLPIIEQDTAIADALETVNNEVLIPRNGYRSGVKKLLFLITDGRETFKNDSDVVRQATYLKRNHQAEVFTIGVTENVDEEQLNNIASTPVATHVFRVERFNQLESQISIIRSEACSLENAAPDPCPNDQADIVFLVDSSGSIGSSDPADGPGTNWQQMQQFMVDVMGEMNLGPYNVRVALITFGSDVKAIYNFTAFQTNKEFETAILAFEYTDRGQTNTAAGIRALDEMFSPEYGHRPGVSKICIVLTDGQSTDNEEETIPEARRAQEKGVRMLAVGISDEVDLEEVRGISSLPQAEGETYWPAPTFQSLSQLTRNVRGRICTNLLEPGCNLADILIVLDASGSIRHSGQENWEKMLNFTNGIIGMFPVAQDNVRISLIRFSTSNRIELYLNNNYTRGGLIDYVNNLELVGSRTAIADAFSRAYDEVFVEENGDRPEVRNMLFLLTDGKETERSHEEVVEEARRLKEDKGVEIFTVGILGDVDEYELLTISSEPADSHYYSVENFDQLQPILSDVIDGACDVPSTECKAGEKTDIVFLLDRSGSIRENDPEDNPGQNWNKVQNFMADITERMTIGPDDTLVSVVAFANSAHLMFNFSAYQNKRDLSNRLRTLEYGNGGNTNTSGGFRVVMEQAFTVENGYRPGSHKVCILLTDGWNTRDTNRTETDALLAQSLGIRILAVGVGSEINKQQLQSLSSQPQQEGVTYWKAPTFSTLVQIDQLVIQKICVDPISKECDMADVAILLERGQSRESLYIGSADWETLKDVTQDLVETFPVAENASRLSLTSFDSEANVEFLLNQYYNKQDMNHVIDNLTLSTGRGGITEALTSVQTQVFLQQNGARVNNRKIVMLLAYSEDSQPGSLQSTAEFLRTTNNAEIYAVGISPYSNTTQLRSVVNEPADDYLFYAENMVQLKAQVDDIRSRVCSDFEVPDNVLDCPDSQADIVFLIDRSGSINDTSTGTGDASNWGIIKKFMVDFASRLTIGSKAIQISVVTFDNNADLQFGFNNYTSKSDLLNRLRTIPYGAREHTNTSAGIRVMLNEAFTVEHGHRPGITKIGIVVTDGRSNLDEHRTISDAEQARRSGVRMLVVGVTDQVYEPEVQAISSPPQVLGETYWLTPSYQSLLKIIESISSKTCPDPAPITNIVDEECPRGKMDLVFLVDRSGSIAKTRPIHQQGTNWEDVITFMTGLVQELTIGPDNVQVALVTFGNGAARHFNFTQYPTYDSLMNRLGKTEYVDEGNTNTSAGIFTVIETFEGNHGHRPDASKVCIILTDGNSTRDPEKTIPNAELAHNSGIRMLAIGIGDQINREELREISSTPHELNQTYWLSPSFTILTQLSETVLNETCKSSFLPECDVVDVVILMDASGSIGNNWDDMQDFVIDLISTFPIGEDNTRISLVRFSENVTVEFYLNQIYSRSQMLAIVRALPLIGGHTAIADALEVINNDVFTTRNGYRDDVKKLVFLVTDGRETIRSNSEVTEQAAILKRQHQAEIFTVGITNEVDVEQLNSIASTPVSTHALSVERFDQLESQISNIRQEACSTENEPVEACPDDQADIVFLVDSSGSIGSSDPINGTGTNWQQMQRFMVDVMDEMYIGPYNVRVALITFGSQVRTVYNFNSFETNSQFTEAILQFNYTDRGRTDTASAILALDEMFQPANGHRPDVSKICIVLTDGRSTEAPERTIPEALNAQAKGIRMLVVGISDEVDMQEIMGISSPPREEGETYWPAPTFASLSQLTRVVRGRICKDVPTAECNRADILIILDASGSIQHAGRTNWAKMLDFTNGIIGNFPVSQENVRISLIRFSTSNRIELYLNNNHTRGELIDFVNNLELIGSRTAIADAFGRAYDEVFVEANGDRPEVRNMLFLLTDGKETERSHEEVVEEARRLKEDKGVEIFTVGILGDVNEYELLTISSEPADSHYYSVGNFDELQPILSDVIDGACDTPSTSCEAGDKTDIVFLLDRSGSIRDNDPEDRPGQNWNKVQNFMADLTEKMIIGPDDTQVSVVAFANGASLLFNFTTYQNNQDLSDTLRTLEYGSGGNTNTSAGIRVMIDEAFTVHNGYRPGAHKVCIVLTDGWPTRDVHRTVDDAERAQALGIRILSVGVGHEINKTNLQSIASPPRREGETFWKAPTFSTLNQISKLVSREICVDPVVKECSTADVSIILDSGRDREGLYVDTTSTTQNWEVIKSFTGDLVQTFPVAENASHVSLTTFGSTAQVEFLLRDYYTTHEMRNIISELSLSRGAGGMTDALRTARRDVMGERNGARGGNRQVVMLLTYGQDLEPETTETFADALKTEYNAEIYSIGVTPYVNNTQLRAVVSEPVEDYMFYAENFVQLKNQMEDIRSRVCTDYEPPNNVLDCPDSQADIVFLVDRSGSINDTSRGTGDASNWGKIRKFMMDFSSGLSIGPKAIQISVVTFDNSADLQFGFNNYTSKSDLLNRLRTIPYGAREHTNTSAGIRVMMNEAFTAEHGHRPDATKICIVLTDGRSNLDEHRTIPDAEQAKRLGIRMLVVGITDQVYEPEIRGISSLPQQLGETYWLTPSFSSLQTITADVSNKTCPTDEACGDVDVVFAIDASGSVRNTNFMHVRQFVVDILDKLSIDNGMTRVGILKYGNGEDIERYNLGTLPTSSEAIEAVENLEYVRRREGVVRNDVMQIVYEDMFSERYNDATKRDIVILVSHGGSPDQAESFRQAQYAKDAGIHMVVVAAGDWVTGSEVKAIASYPTQRNLLMPPYYNRLTEYVEEVKDIICNTVDECSTNPCERGRQCEDDFNMHWCHCESDYGGINCEKQNRRPADITFTIDSSSSITKSNFYQMSSFLLSTAEQLSLGDQTRLGFQTYNGRIRHYFHLDKYTTKKQYLNALTVPYFTGGDTDTRAALQNLYQEIYHNRNGDRDSYDNVAVIVTDGMSANTTGTWREAIRARELGIHVIVVLIQGEYGNGEYEGSLIASFPLEQNLIRVERFEDLPSRVDQLVDLLTDDADECMSDPCQNSGTCEDLRGGYRCRCTTEYTGVHCERGCSGEMDITLIIDKSGSNRLDRFNAVISSVVELVKQFEISEGKTRIAAISFSRVARVEFHLDTYMDKKNIIDAIKQIEYDRGSTNITGALDLLRHQVLVHRGARQGVKKLAFIATDGHSTIARDELLQTARDTKILGHVQLVVITNRADVNKLQLYSIASHPPRANMILPTEATRASFDMIAQAVQATCPDDPCSTNPCSNGACVPMNGDYYCSCDSDMGVACSIGCSTDTEVDLLLLVGVSGDADRQVLFANLAKTIIEHVMNDGRTRIALISFNNNERDTVVQFDFETYTTKADLLEAATFIARDRRSSLLEGLTAARNLLERQSDSSSRRQVITLITDGAPDIKDSRTQSAAQRLLDQGTAIHVIGLDGRVWERDLQRLGSRQTNPLTEGAELRYSYTHVLQRDGSNQRDIAQQVTYSICEETAP